MKRYSLFCMLVMLLLTGLSQLKAQTTDYALDFDGTFNRLEVTMTPALSLANEFTFEAWINPRAKASGQAMIASQLDNVPGTPALPCKAGWNLFRDITTGQLEMAVSPGFGSCAGVIRLGGGNLPLNTWTHVALTISSSGTTRTIRIYVNGSQVNTTTYTGNFVPLATGRTFFIGNQEDLLVLNRGDRAFPGQLDEIRLWNYARSQSQLQSAQSNCLSGTESGLVGYWRLNDGPGSATAADLSGNNHTARLVAMDPNTDWTAQTAGACVNFSNQSVPTLSQWGLIVLGLCLLCWGALVLRRNPLPFHKA